MLHAFEKRARALRVFDDEIVDSPHYFDRRRGQQRTHRSAERCRDEVQDACGHAQMTSTPAWPSMVVRVTRGRPMSAVGSVDSTRATRAIPSPSILALPAQSKGASISR